MTSTSPRRGVIMRSRAYRRFHNQGNSRRRTIGAVAVAGVVAAMGVAGVQLASASTEKTNAAGVVTVDGRQFDVSTCQKLDIAAGAVVCDGEELAPIEEQAPGDAAAASAQALEAACDTFAADV